MISREHLSNEFIKLVSIDSPSFGEKEMGEYLKKRLLEFGFTVEEDDAGSKINGNCGNIHGFLAGKMEIPPILFCSHMDTVEPSCQKQAVLDSEGFIRSKGNTVLGADDCSGIVAILEALNEIKDNNLEHRPIEVLFTVAEETYCKGVKEVDFSTIISKEAYVLDLEGKVGTAAYKAPTILSFNAYVKGQSSHAGFAPHKGIHAIQAASDAISKLKLGNIDDNTTLNVGVIHGGLATNIIPDLCEVRGEIRSYSHQRALEVAQEVRNQFESSAVAFGAKIRFEVEIGCKAYETPKNHLVVRRFEAACKTLNLPFSLQQTFGGSDNNILAQNGIAGIVLSCAMNQCHSCDEYTTIDELVKIAELTKVLMTSNDEQ
ncbi:MAG: M20/M25/M40 family metallo-hydrolase [Lachnospiraceae bacterium]|nr:M20/M25/M40 family metallo-hydrolase [Lachnospiraceae bacterium]